MRPLFLLVLAALPTFALAQDGRPGYVVVEGDTLRGKVWITTEGRAGEGARFQAPADVFARQVSVGEASAFGEDGGRTYRRGRFTVRPGGTSEPVLGFARVVRDGAADLLRFESVDGLSVYVLELDGERTTLYGPAPEEAAEAAGYRQALTHALGSCAAAADRARAVGYHETDLAAAVDIYNICREPGYVGVTPAPRRPRARLRLELSGGRSTSTFVRGTPGPSLDPGQSSAQVGVLAEVAPGVFSRSLTWAAGLEYDRGVVEVANQPLFRRPTASAHDALMLSLGGRATLPAAGTPVYLGAGIVYGTTTARSDTVLEYGDAPPPGFLIDMSPRAINSLGGFYVEAGLRPLGGRFGVRARYRDVTFSNQTFYVPGDTNLDVGSVKGGVRRYGLRSAQVSATARL